MIKNNLPSGNSSGIRVDGHRDMVELYNPYTKQWVDYQNTGVIVLPATIVITTTTLNGQPVTCVIGDYSETTVFVDGVATFKNIFNTGTATITNTEFSITVEVTELGQTYEAELEEVVELVLWDGSSAQNGAEKKSDGVKYTVDFDKLIGKSLCFTLSNAINGCFIYLIAYTSSYAEATFYMKNDSTWASGNPSTTWEAKDYSFSFDELDVTSEDYVSFELRIMTASTFKNYCSKIWLE